MFPNKGTISRNAVSLRWLVNCTPRTSCKESQSMRWGDELPMWLFTPWYFNLSDVQSDLAWVLSHNLHVYYFFWVNHQKGCSNIYPLIQCSLIVNEGDWYIVAGNDERFNSHCSTLKLHTGHVVSSWTDKSKNNL